MAQLRLFIQICGRWLQCLFGCQDFLNWGFGLKVTVEIVVLRRGAVLSLMNVLVLADEVAVNRRDGNLNVSILLFWHHAFLPHIRLDLTFLLLRHNSKFIQFQKLLTNSYHLLIRILLQIVPNGILHVEYRKIRRLDEVVPLVRIVVI